MNEMEIRQHAYETVCGHYKVAGPLDFLRTLREHASDLKGRAGDAASSMMSRLERPDHNGQIGPHPFPLSPSRGAERYDPMNYIPYSSAMLAQPKLDPRQFHTDVAKSLLNQIPDPILPHAGPHRPLYGNYGYEMPKLSSLIDRLAQRKPVVGPPARDYHAQFDHARALGISRPGERARYFDSPAGSPPSAAQIARDHFNQQELALTDSLNRGVSEYGPSGPPSREPSRKRYYDNADGSPNAELLALEEFRRNERSRPNLQHGFAVDPSRPPLRPRTYDP